MGPTAPTLGASGGSPETGGSNGCLTWPIGPWAGALAGRQLFVVTGILGPWRPDSADNDVLARHLHDWRRLAVAARERGDGVRADELAQVVADYEAEVTARAEAVVAAPGRQPGD